MTSTGEYAIPAIDAYVLITTTLCLLYCSGDMTSKLSLYRCREAYAQGKKERPPFVPQDQPSSEDDADPIPDELLCPICNDLMVDAVVIPCCGNSYCDDCKFFSLWLNNNTRLKASSLKCIYCKHCIYSSKHWAIAMIYAALKGGNIVVKVTIMKKKKKQLSCSIIGDKNAKRVEARLIRSERLKIGYFFSIEL